jgi:prophage maintenance system killer protein
MLIKFKQLCVQSSRYTIFSIDDSYYVIKAHTLPNKNKTFAIYFSSCFLSLISMEHLRDANLKSLIMNLAPKMAARANGTIEAPSNRLLVQLLNVKPVCNIPCTIFALIACY